MGSHLNRIAFLLGVSLQVMLSLLAPATAGAQAPEANTFDAKVAGAVAEVRAKHELPALAALVFTADGKTLSLAVDGFLRAGDTTPVLPDSLWHIGSNTMAMTATLAAVLVADGKIDLSFDTPVSEALPEIADKMHDDAKAITLVELLNHTAGLPANPDFAEKRRIIKAGTDLARQRLELATWALAKKPATEPGSTFLYSNVGYIIAGAVLESATGVSWEKLMETRLFKPLGIDSGGFGPPQGRQPEGHRPDPDSDSNGLKAAGQRSDNPAFYGPAGTVHLSLGDWLEFGADHLREARSKFSADHSALLSTGAYRRLHTPTPGAKEYAYGWGLYRGAPGTLPLLVHDGSNTEWYARIMLNRQAGIGILMVSNAGPDYAKPAIDALGRRISESLQAAPTPAP